MTPRTDITGRPVELRDVDLDTFFRPSRVAVIGASDNRRPNDIIWRKIRDWAEEFDAEVIPINPRRDEIDGVKCYRSILDVDGEIDLAVILVGAAVDMFETVLEKKARFAVIFAAGFAETDDGEEPQRRLEDLVATGETHLLGPNTNLNAFESFRDDLGDRRIALITQSGHQGRPVYQSQELGVAMSHWAPAGNEVDLEFADFARYFTDLDTTGAIAAYIEGFKDGRTMMLAADHAAKAGVPLVCVKVGRTDEGSSMAKSHTGHLTGSDRVTSDVFRQLGVIRVDGLDELTDVASTFCRTVAPPEGRAKERRVCVYSISGGTGAHMADLVAEAGMSLPELTQQTQEVLRSHIPGYLRVNNPVDSGGAPSSDERGIEILRAIVADDNVDMVIIPITGAVASISVAFTRDIAIVAKETDKAIFVVWGSPTWDDVYENTLLPAQIPVFRTFANCVTTAAAWFDHHEFSERYRSVFDKLPLKASRKRARVEHLVEGSGALSEHDSKEVLAAYGIPVTRDVLCTSAAEAARAAKELDSGSGVVMKVASPDIGHKSDLGLVKVGVSGQSAVRSAFAEIMDTAEAETPKGKRIDGVLVCELAEPGVECVVGVSRDELFGPVVMFGLGGVFVEVFGDVAFRVPPFDRSEARRMIDQTRGAKLLAGARGRPKAKVAAVVDVLMRIQQLAMDFADDITELDINPLVVRPDGAVALDALIVRG
ncbi:MAG: acetate--CoA ligase family protein [Microthrixaceae bacterium]